MYEFLQGSLETAAARIREEAQDPEQHVPSSPERGFLPYPSLIQHYQFLGADCSSHAFFHPGLASEFPIDTLISAINAYLGCNYIQAREQLCSLIKFNLANPEMQPQAPGDNLIMAIESLNRCIVANDRLLAVDERFRWKRTKLELYRDRQYNLTYEL